MKIYYRIERICAATDQTDPGFVKIYYRIESEIIYAVSDIVDQLWKIYYRIESCG